MTTLSTLEEQKAEMLQAVAGWSKARLAYCPAPGEWSVVEMLDHIVKVEVAITDAAQKGLQSPHPLGIRDRMGFLFLDRIFRSARRVKVPNSARHVLPGEDLDLGAISQRWGSSRVELEQFVKSVNPSQMQAGIFRHPVSGWMTLPQVLTFFSVHMKHHEFQLARLKAASDQLAV